MTYIIFLAPIKHYFCNVIANKYAKHVVYILGVNRDIKNLSHIGLGFFNW